MRDEQFDKMQKMMVGPPPTNLESAQFLATIPSWKHDDPRIVKAARMMATGPYLPADAMAALDAVREALEEAEHELFYDVNVTQASELHFIHNGAVTHIDHHGPLVEQIQYVIGLAAGLHVERIVVDEIGVGLTAYLELLRDAERPGERRPWKVVKLGRIAMRRRAAS